MRPVEYCRTFVVMQDVSYTAIEDDAQKSVPRIGMLPVGRGLWLPMEEQQLGEARVKAFVEGIGLIAVSRNSIAKVKSRWRI